jgi:hypothetical protein
MIDGGPNHATPLPVGGYTLPDGAVLSAVYTPAKFASISTCLSAPANLGSLRKAREKRTQYK